MDSDNTYNEPENNENSQESIETPPPITPPLEPEKPKFNSLSEIPRPTTIRKNSSGWKIFFIIFLVMSVLVNLLLFGTIMLVAAFSPDGGEAGFKEHSIAKGSSASKIGVIRIEGVINMQMADTVIRQIEKAKYDSKVQGLIIRTISPGGSVVASDEIHHAITTYREETEKPVVAFMQGIAASGGYYTSVACDQIIAEPTTITGSIGVIMQTFTLEELFVEKLGIEAVTMKSGRKKDWPTTYSQVTDEQRDYLMEKLISPAYDRFVTLIDKGRDGLNLEQVKTLGDGSIYHATEALETGLIDEIGYMEEAIDLISELSGVSNPYVFEYTEEFRFSSLLGAEGSSKSLIQMNKNDIRNALTPELLYLWNGIN